MQEHLIDLQEHLTHLQEHLTDSPASDSLLIRVIPGGLYRHLPLSNFTDAITTIPREVIHLNPNPKP
jgi:hypothetical protein